MRKGINIIGSPNLMKSKANEEIIQKHKHPSWSYFRLIKFSFTPLEDCHVRINKGEEIFLPKTQILNIEVDDVDITTFEIVEPNISYTYLGSY